MKGLPRPLRCAISNACSHSLRPTSIRFYSDGRPPPLSRPGKNPDGEDRPDIKQRQELFKELGVEPYPRVEYDERAIEVERFIAKYGETLGNGGRGEEVVTLRGRIGRKSASSSKLYFYDIVQDGKKLQAVCSLRNFDGTREEFTRMHHLFHRGDHISMTGIPGKTNVGELSIFTSAQSLLSPCLHPPPLTPLDLDKRMRNRHIDLMVNQSAANAIRVRSQIFTYLREFLVERGFVEVETPILSDTMGGASATPFTTQSKVTGKKELSLRIAPELWLKRLVIGGLDRVFEIGKCFRNEGIDATHNPEFTSCEYYQAYANLDDLIRCTEDLLSGMVGHLKDGDLTILNPTDPTDGEPISFAKPFRRMEFIPALEIAMGRKLPQLDDENTTESLLTLLKDLGIQPPSPPTPAKILDKLASHYLEPQCVQPTFITHIPEIMSPLAKGSEINGHRVSHRFELYVNAQEICNAYEEENDPISQRAKFTLQQSDRESGDSEIPAVDESFVHALEWGLPPTGGWGMGIDRWVMLMTGKTRIGEVLSFGGLKHVVGQGLGLRAPGEKEVQKDKESNDLQ